MGNLAKRIQYRYDTRGNRQSLIDPDGGRFTYAYDARNRIQSVQNPQGDRTTYSYDVRNRRTETRLANGTRTSYVYDAVSNLRGLSNLKSDGSAISDLQYSYDRTGNRTSVVEADGSRVTWSYDAASQLTGEDRPDSVPEHICLRPGRKPDAEERRGCEDHLQLRRGEPAEVVPGRVRPNNLHL